jgi:hypothetical protein
MQDYCSLDLLPEQKPAYWKELNQMQLLQIDLQHLCWWAFPHLKVENPLGIPDKKSVLNASPAWSDDEEDEARTLTASDMDSEINLEWKCLDPTFLGRVINFQFSMFYHIKRVQQPLGRTPAPALTIAMSKWRAQGQRFFRKSSAKSMAQKPLLQMGMHQIWNWVYKITRESKSGLRHL